MAGWTVWNWTFSIADEAAFEDKDRINLHFRLPGFANIYSLALNSSGKSNVHEAGKKGRRAYLGNYLAYAYIRHLNPDAWIWDERYRFEGEPVDWEMRCAQHDFVKKFGEERLNLIRREARKAGLDPGEKTNGRPDLAVHFPGQEIEWRFIEIKLPGDKLRESQKEWLRLFSKVLGSETAVVLQFERDASQDKR